MTTTVLNAKNAEIEKTIPEVSGLVQKQTDYNTKISDIEKK